MQTNNPCELLTATMPVGSGDLLDGKCPMCGKPNPRRHGFQYKTCSRKCGYDFFKKYSTENVKKAFKKNQKVGYEKKRGGHGCGRAARDRKDHPRAKCFRIRNPLGTVFEVKNITSWCRENEQTFKHDDLIPNTRTPLWERARKGINDVCLGKRCSWFGWTGVCVFDIESDPLARREALPSNIRS